MCRCNHMDQIKTYYGNLSNLLVNSKSIAKIRPSVLYGISCFTSQGWSLHHFLCHLCPWVHFPPAEQDGIRKKHVKNYRFHGFHRFHRFHRYTEDSQIIFEGKILPNFASMIQNSVNFVLPDVRSTVSRACFPRRLAISTGPGCTQQT